MPHFQYTLYFFYDSSMYKTFSIFTDFTNKEQTSIMAYLPSPH